MAEWDGKCPVTGRPCEFFSFCEQGISLQDDEQEEEGVYPLQVSSQTVAGWHEDIKVAVETSFCSDERISGLEELKIDSLNPTVKIAASKMIENIFFARQFQRRRPEA